MNLNRLNQALLVVMFIFGATAFCLWFNRAFPKAFTVFGALCTLIAFIGWIYILLEKGEK
jgi:lipopolysaccharide export LptBFGC system permease protein LptF